jgi:hypothetical protein
MELKEKTKRRLGNMRRFSNEAQKEEAPSSH